MSGFLRRVAIGGAVTLVSLATIKAMALLNSIIAARLLGPADYGAFSIIVNLQSFVVILACMGVPLAMAKYVAQWRDTDPAVAAEIGASLMRVLVISSAVTSLLYFILADTIAVNIYTNQSLVWPIRISSLFVIVSSLNIALSSITQGCLRISALARTNALVAVIAQPLTLVFIHLFGLFGAILAQTCSLSISVLLLWSIVRRTMPISLRRIREKGHYADSRVFSSFTLPAFLSSLLLVPAFWIGRTILAVNWGFDSVGEFQVAESLSQLMLIIPAALSVPLLPLISEMHAKESRVVGESSSSLLRIVIFAVVPVSILAFPILDALIETMYGAEYQSASTTTALMFVSSTLVAISTVMSTVIIGTGRMWLGLGMNTIWATCFFASAVLLVPSEESEGLAMAYVLSYSIYFAMLLAYFKREFRIRAAPILMSLAMFISFAITYVLILTSYSFGAGLGGAAAASLATATVVYVFVIEPREKEMITSILKSLVRRARA